MKQIKQNVVAFFLFFVLPFALLGQRSISGVVTDAETAEPLIGVNILVVGTSTGTTTDFDGKYELNLPSDATEIQFSYTGYQPIQLTVGVSNQLDVQMTSGQLLDEVVVIGYGTVKREDATGSVQTVNSEQFNRGAITGPQELLSGKIAGVNITSSADPGGGAQIRIRGGSSVIASNDPLIVIDGVPIETEEVGGSRNFLNIINPNDIATFTVLKDASATAIYGSRASNGVILITTKKGKLGDKLRINYNGNVSFSQAIETVDVLSADEYRSIINEQFDEGHPARDILGDANTDWQSEIYETAIAHDHNINLSGGLEFLPYRLSLGHTDKKGILKTDRFTRNTLNLNLSPGFLENTLQFNVNAKASFIKNHFADRGAIGNALNFDPTQPIFDADSPYGGFFTWTDNDGLPITIANTNPMALLNQKQDDSDVQRYIISGSVDYRFGFLPDLRANLNLSHDYSKGEGTVIIPEEASWKYDAINGGGENKIYSQNRTNQLLEFYLNYGKELGDSKIEAMTGYSWQRFNFEEEEFSTNFSGTADSVEIKDAGELYLLSLFGRLNYTFKERYLLTLTLRSDASSRFSSETRWGLFPAAAFAWKILDGNANGPLTDLKLRLGYGVTGQQEVGTFYEYLSTYTGSEPTAQYQFGSDFFITLRPGPYDLFLKWEETTTYNAGLDFRLKNDRVSGSIDVYRRISKDLLNEVPIPIGTNFSNRLTTNIGNLENTGLEFSINSIPVKTKNLLLEIGGNVALNKNEITKLTLVDDPNYQGIFVGNISGGVGNTIQIRSVGFPVDAFFVYEQVYDEAANPIEEQYVDLNGDGMVTPDDRYQLEKPAPDVVLGLTAGLQIQNFNLSFAGRAKFGNYVYNNVLSEHAHYSRLYNSVGTLSNVHSDINNIRFEIPQYFSDFYIQNGSFFRLDHVTLGYNFSDLIKGVSNLRLYATVQNPLLITNYKGIDPEIEDGIDKTLYPRSRTFLLGLNAGF